MNDVSRGQFARYLIRYVQPQHASTLRIGTLDYYRDLEGTQADHHDGRLAFHDGKIVLPNPKIDYGTYLSVENCYIACFTLQAKRVPLSQLVERFGTKSIQVCGLVRPPINGDCTVLMKEKGNRIPMYADSREDPKRQRGNRIRMHVDLNFAKHLCQELYLHMKRSNRSRIIDTERYELRHWSGVVTYVDGGSPVLEHDADKEQIFGATLFGKESQYAPEMEYRIAIRVFDKLQSRFVGVGYDPIDIPYDGILNPQIKYFGADDPDNPSVVNIKLNSN